MKEIRGVVVDGLTVGKAVLSEPKLKACTPIQWREFYEKQARELRKENDTLRSFVSWFIDGLRFALYDTAGGCVTMNREEIVADMREQGVTGIE